MYSQPHMNSRESRTHFHKCGIKICEAASNLDPDQDLRKPLNDRQCFRKQVGSRLDGDQIPRKATILLLLQPIGAQSSWVIVGRRFTWMTLENRSYKSSLILFFKRFPIK